MKIKTPDSLSEEHEGIFQELHEYSELKDQTGASMRELLTTLKPHFEKEEEIAMPLLGLLTPLAAGKKIKNPREALTLHERLRHAYREMFSEHEQIRGMVAKARQSAEKENHKEVVDFLDALAHHAKVEEEVLYPAALLAGAILKTNV